MASLLEDIEQWIIENNLGQADGVDLFRDTIPDEPDSVVTLFEYDSRTAATKFNPVVVRYVQVIARDPQPTVSRQKAASLFKLFNQWEEGITDLPNDRWAIIKPLQSPFKVSEDNRRRSYYGFNVAITTNSD